MAQLDPNENYKRQIECDYKAHHYSVRDNGAIMRHEEGLFPSVGAEWTFGEPKSNGRLQYKGVNVERVVATAFIGPIPGDFHVIDHIDGNLENNRPENLRIFSPLEDILDNEETVNAIQERCGDINVFLSKPSLIASSGNRYGRFMVVKGDLILKAIEHLVVMSADAPLRTGSIYVDWYKQYSSGQNAACEKGESVEMDDAFLDEWGKMLASYSDKPRLHSFFQTCKKELNRNGENLTLTLYTRNEAQANWMRENIVPDIKHHFSSAMAIPSFAVRIETE